MVRRQTRGRVINKIKSNIGFEIGSLEAIPSNLDYGLEPRHLFSTVSFGNEKGPRGTIWIQDNLSPTQIGIDSTGRDEEEGMKRNALAPMIFEGLFETKVYSLLTHQFQHKLDQHKLHSFSAIFFLNQA